MHRKMPVWKLFLNKIKKIHRSQVFSCEFYEIFRNTFFHGTPPVAAPVAQVFSLRSAYAYIHMIIKSCVFLLHIQIS